MSILIYIYLQLESIYTLSFLHILSRKIYTVHAGKAKSDT